MKLELELTEFQFLIGRLKTKMFASGDIKRAAFQFLIGRLKTVC